MSTQYPQLTGIHPILSMTYHDDDRIDHDGLIAQAEFLIDAGVSGIGFGFGSEIYRLTDVERDAALAAVAAAVNGRLPIITATSAHSTAATIERSRAAQAAGASTLMITPPGMAVLDSDQIFSHYASIAAQLRMPIIVQDAPSFSGVSMPESLMERMAREIDEVVAIKIETLPPAPKVGSMVKRIGQSAAVLGGAGGIDFIHELERGAAGTIPGAALPELFLAVFNAFEKGQRTEARQLFNRFAPLGYLAWRSMDTFLFTQKEILRRRGIISSAHMRAPSERIEPVFMAELETLMFELGIDQSGASWHPDSTLPKSD